MTPSKYLQQFTNYFWYYEENELVFTNLNGNTICYQKYAAHLIEKLSPNSIPTFGPLLLSLIATNHYAKEDLIYIRSELHKIFQQETQGKKNPYIEEAFTFLDNLRKMPTHLKSDVNRILVFEVIFRNVHNGVAQRTAQQIANILKLEISPTKAPKPLPISILIQDLRLLSLLHRQFGSTEKIIKALQGLPVLTEDIEFDTDQKDDQNPQSYLQILEENVHTYPIASLLTHIWAGLHIPIHHSLASEQPLGGFNSLSNKGNYDRLLISEFAHDDLMLMNRLANNEALFIHREIPPQNHDFERLILVDVSLRNWGDIRFLALALAMSIGKHPKTDIECSIFAVGATFTGIDFHTLSDTLIAIKQVSTAIDASDGLNHFLATYQHSKAFETIFITSQQTYKSSQFAKWIFEHQNVFNYVLTITEDLEVDVLKFHKHERKLLQKLAIDVPQIWKKAKTKIKTTVNHTVASQILTDTDTLPIDCPILLPNSHIDHRRILSCKQNHFYKILKNNTLLINESAQLGWKLIYAQIPVSVTAFAIGYNDAQERLLLYCNFNKKLLTIVNLTTHETMSIVFKELNKHKNNGNFYFYEEKFVYTNLSTTTDVNINFAFTIHIQDSLESGMPKSINIEPIIHKNMIKTIREAIKETEVKKDKDYYKLITQNAIRTLKQVYINLDGLLVLNNHALNLRHEQILLLSNQQRKPLHQAKKIKFNLFEFPNKSQVYLDKSGFFKLIFPPTAEAIDSRSANIYFPSALDLPIALATDTSFCGNNYYYNKDIEQEKINPALFWETHLLPFLAP